MSKLSAQTVLDAIRRLRALDLSPKGNSPLEAFLVARRMQAKGVQPSIDDAERAVRDMFVLFPDEADGRLFPFRRDRGGGGGPLWGRVDGSARMTVWTAGSRHNARELFEGAHIENGLAADAPAKLAGLLSGLTAGDGRPPRQALLAYLLRDHDFADATVDLPLLEEAARSEFGLTADDLDLIARRIAEPPPSTVEPSWSADALGAQERPSRPASPAAVALPAAPMPPSEPTRPSRIVAEPRVRRMVEVAIRTSRAVLLVGAPGTGKSSLLREVVDGMVADPAGRGFGAARPGPARPGPAMWTTADESWTAREVVGGETVSAGEVVFRPGHLLESILQNRWLAIDELNRADMDRIFGPAFTWLSADPNETPPVRLGRRDQREGAPEIELAWNSGPDCAVDGREFLSGGGAPPGGRIVFRAGTAWRLLGTYNVADAQRVFRVGQALGRRFVRVPVPVIAPDDFRQALDARGGGPAADRIVALYRAHYAAPETRLGPALFLRMAEYVRGALAAAGRDFEAEYEGDEIRAAAVAEAYVANAGPWLARLESDQVAALKGRAVGPSLPFDEEQWEWIAGTLPSLG